MPIDVDPALLIPFTVPTEPPDPVLEEPVRVLRDSFSSVPPSSPFPFTPSRIDPDPLSAGLGFPPLPLAFAFANFSDNERESDSITGEK